ncbi:hypothetical protein Ddc_04306 [Ditylenchus destructor]|nr:hypothetical protein Ddc_04306 [Ditylenchus destructor]
MATISYIGPTALKPLTPLQPPPVRKLTAHSLPTSNTASSPRSAPPDFNWSYHLDIISALKGNIHNYISRSCVAESIYALTEDTKTKLIDFIASMQGAIASTLENNACKQFNCAPDDLESMFNADVDMEEVLEKLFQLWDALLHQIVPNTFGMLYPLEQFDASFGVKRTVLIHFRDRVLVRLFCRFNPPLELCVLNKWRKLFSIFSTIDMETKNDSSFEYKLFEKLFLRLVRSGTDPSGFGSATEPSDVRIYSLSSKEIRNYGEDIPCETKTKSIMRKSPHSFSEFVVPYEDEVECRGCSTTTETNKVEGIFFLGQYTKARVPTFDEKPAGERKARAKTLPTHKNVHWDDQTTVHV